MPQEKRNLQKGEKFGLLTVIRELEKEERKRQDRRYFELSCECGKTITTQLYQLVKSKNPILSCGCERKKTNKKRFDERFEEVVGKKFGRLTVLTTQNIEGGRRKISCLCDCGNNITTLMTNVIRGKTNSCGCYHKDIVRSTQIWEVELKQYIHKSVHGRNLNFHLTLEEFKSLCQQNCVYCGSPPSTKTCVGGEFRNGIDRQDNNIDYVASNCVPCCKFCNRAKLSSSLDDFLSWIQRLKNFNP